MLGGVLAVLQLPGHRVLIGDGLPVPAGLHRGSLRARSPSVVTRRYRGSARARGCYRRRGIPIPLAG